MEIPTTKSPEELLLDDSTETSTRIRPIKPFGFTNGVLKRHHHNHNHNQPPQPAVVLYKDCLKNHAAALGGHALDGCGEFMPSPSATASDPTSLKCAACGCHRNFHRREPEDPPLHMCTTTPAIEYQPHHRHHPPPPPMNFPESGNRSPSSASPPPISSSFYPSAPHMLLALSGGASAPQSGNPNSRKRFRTKFTQTQKEKMLDFAERVVGWKIQKKDEELIKDFCNGIGVDKGVLKVWMHNNKNTFAKRDFNVSRKFNNNGNGNANGNGHENKIHHGFENNRDQYEIHVNGSSSSS